MILIFTFSLHALSYHFACGARIMLFVSTLSLGYSVTFLFEYMPNLTLLIYFHQNEDVWK